MKANKQFTVLSEEKKLQGILRMSTPQVLAKATSIHTILDSNITLSSEENLNRELILNPGKHTVANCWQYDSSLYPRSPKNRLTLYELTSQKQQN